MGKEQWVDEVPCQCGKGVIKVDHVESDHSFNFWARDTLKEHCPACGSGDYEKARKLVAEKTPFPLPPV